MRKAIIFLLIFLSAQVFSLDLQKGYGDLVLGLSYEDLSKRLTENGGFDYAGQPEVSLSPNGKEKIIETYGGKYINRAIFQFDNNICFSIILELKLNQLDYFMLFQSFSGRYGEPLLLDPKSARWVQGDVILQLEKPLVLKYMTKSVIDQKLKSSQIEKANEEVQKDDFIKKL